MHFPSAITAGYPSVSMFRVCSFFSRATSVMTPSAGIRRVGLSWVSFCTGGLWLRALMIVLYASFPIDPNRRDEALELIESLVDQSQAEDGILEYRATTDITASNVVRFFERYEDAEAFEAHKRTAHFQAFEDALPDILAGEPQAIRFNGDSATELEL